MANADLNRKVPQDNVDRCIRLARAGGRMRIISENIANADSTPSSSGTDPYLRKVPTFVTEFDGTLDARLVELGRVHMDMSDFRLKYAGAPGRGPQRQIPERQSADRNDRHARGTAVLRGQCQRDQPHRRMIQRCWP